MKKIGCKEKIICTKKDNLITITVLDNFFIVYIQKYKEAKKYSLKDLELYKRILKSKSYHFNIYKIN